METACLALSFLSRALKHDSWTKKLQSWGALSSNNYIIIVFCSRDGPVLRRNGRLVFSIWSFQHTWEFLRLHLALISWKIKEHWLWVRKKFRFYQQRRLKSYLDGLVNSKHWAIKTMTLRVLLSVPREMQFFGSLLVLRTHLTCAIDRRCSLLSAKMA